MNTEAVTNVAGRPDLLAAVCVLGGFLLYYSPSASHWRLPALFLASLAGVFSKESAVILLPVCLLFDWWARRRPDRAACLVIAVPVLLRILVPFGGAMARPFVDNPIFGAGFWVGKMTAVKVLGKLVSLWVWPGTLSADYSYNQVPLWTSAPWQTAVFAAFMAFMVVVAVITFVLYRHRGLPAPAVFWALFAAGALLPTSNLLLPIGTVMAERFLYLPGFGLAGLVVAGVAWCAPRLRLQPAGVLAVFVGLLGVRTGLRNEDWNQAGLGFWQRTAAAAPFSFKAHSQLAAEYAALGRIQEAANEADIVVKILEPLPPENSTMMPYSQFFGYYVQLGQEGKARLMGNKVADVMNSTPEMKRRRRFQPVNPRSEGQPSPGTAQ